MVTLFRAGLVDPRKKMAKECHPGHETIRPLKGEINNTESRSACAAEGVEQMESESEVQYNINRGWGSGNRGWKKEYDKGSDPIQTVPGRSR